MTEADELGALREKIRALEESNQEKDRLLGMLAHDLRNPLSAIRSASEVLMLTLGSEPRVQRAHAILERQTVQMTRMIDRLTEVAQIARGDLMLQRTTVDLAQLSRRALAENSERVATADLKLESTVPADAIWVNADAVRMSQIFEALFTNAIKYGQPRGKISVTVERNGASAIVKFARDGDRIEPSLGLVFVKGLIELHGGTMTAVAETGRSAVFELRVPLSA